MAENKEDQTSENKTSTRKATPKCNIDKSFRLPNGIKDVEKFLKEHVIFEATDTVYATKAGNDITDTIRNAKPKVKIMHVSEFARVIGSTLEKENLRFIRKNNKDTPYKLYELSQKDLDYFYDLVGFAYANGQPDDTERQKKAMQVMNDATKLRFFNWRINRFIHAPKDVKNLY